MNAIRNLIALCGCLMQACSALGADTAWESLAIYPPDIKLSTAADFQNVIAVAQRTDGITLDVTDQVNWSIEQPNLVKLEGFRLTPLTDGTTQLKASWQALAAQAPIAITAAATPAPD